MTKQLLYQVKDIEVYEIYPPYSIDEPEYIVKQEDLEFGVWEKPTLNYESLRKQILEYKNDKKMEIAADVENEDRREDEESFWELDTEGF